MTGSRPGLLYRNWPTGIRLGEAGISIGAISSGQAARRTRQSTTRAEGYSPAPGRRCRASASSPAGSKNAPRYYTFTNRWGGKRGMNHCNIGVLASPFMRAALVIETDLTAVTAPAIRPARYHNNFTNGYFSRLAQPRLSPVWVVPWRCLPSSIRGARVVQHEYLLFRITRKLS